MTSWKTTLGGIIALLGAALLVVPDAAPGAALVKPWAPFISAVGAGIIGIFGRDNNRSSEQVGAGITLPEEIKPKPSETESPNT